MDEIQELKLEIGLYLRVESAHIGNRLPFEDRNPGLGDPAKAGLKKYDRLRKRVAQLAADDVVVIKGTEEEVIAALNRLIPEFRPSGYNDIMAWMSERCFNAFENDSTWGSLRKVLAYKRMIRLRQLLRDK